MMPESGKVFYWLHDTPYCFDNRQDTSWVNLMTKTFSLETHSAVVVTGHGHGKAKDDCCTVQVIIDGGLQKLQPDVGTSLQNKKNILTALTSFGQPESRTNTHIRTHNLPCTGP